MNPLELFLYLTFLVYAYQYKFKLFIIYILLVALYCVFIQVIMRPPTQTLKQKILASTWKHPNEGPIRVSQELDVTKSFEYVKKLTQQTGVKTTLTHVAIRALGLGLAKFPQIQGHLKFGNFDKVDQLGVIVVTNVDQGKDLVPIEFKGFEHMSVEQIAAFCNQKAKIARRGKDQLHKQRTEVNRKFPNFFIHFMFYMLSYLINNVGMPIKSVHFKGHDFGECALTNVGVFGMKKGFAPMSGSLAIGMIIAMGKAFKKPCVQNGDIVIKDKLLFNYSSDHRYGDGGKAIKCINTIYDYMRDPQQFEKNLKN